MPRKKIKAQLGDLFAIPVAENLNYFGQVIGIDTMIVFDLVDQEQSLPIEKIVEAPIMLFFHTVYTELEDGAWPILGNAPLPEHIVYPEYKVLNYPHQIAVTDFNSKILRLANEIEQKQLGFKSSGNPRTVTRALQARHGLREWAPYYDDLFYRPHK